MGEEWLVHTAPLQNLSAPKLTVLLGGIRALDRGV
jgi:catalase (peroxidase I)